MELTRSSLLVLFFSGLVFFPAIVSSIEINYGQITNNLPSLENVVPLVKSVGTTQVKLYDSYPKVLKAFANTGVEFTIGLDNEFLSKMSDSKNAEAWVRTNDQAYLPGTKRKGEVCSIFKAIP